MSLPAARTRAEAATKELKRTWQDLLTRWDDEVSRSMTKTGIEPIDQELSRTLEAFERVLDRWARFRSWLWSVKLHRPSGSAGLAKFASAPWWQLRLWCG
ncbi:MAG: hypothetical protein AAFR78_09530, partial [Planctomycetota bacterium]